MSQIYPQFRAICAAAATALLLSSSGAQAEQTALGGSAALAYDIRAVAEGMEHIELGGGLALDGAEAQGDALIVRVALPEELIPHASALTGSLVASLCADADAVALMARGVEIRLLYRGPDAAEITSAAVPPGACAAFGGATADPTPTLSEGALSAAERDDVIQSLAADGAPLYLADNIAVAPVAANGARLGLTLQTTGALDEPQLVAMLCADPTLGVLLDAGAELDLARATAEPLALDKAACR